MDTQPKESKDADLLATVRTRFKIMRDADHQNRLEAMEDLKFVNVPGEQWDHNMKQERGNRPCYEFNKVRVSAKRIINDMRANRPSGKIRAVEGGDKETAEINEGLIRNIWNISDGDTIIDYAAEFQVNGGMTAWRVDTEYSDDTAFDQDICLKPILNPFCLYADPSCKDLLKRDAHDWILTETMTHRAFEARWGKKVDKSSFEDQIEFDDEGDWSDEDTVRVAEYWYKVPHEKEIWLMHFPTEGGVDEKVVDSESDEGMAIAQDPAQQAYIVRRRTVQTHKIKWCIASGDKILEKGDWAGRKFPFVMIYGESLVVDGRHRWWGLPRFAKDAQRSYNVARTAISETIAQAPKAQWWATVKQAAGQIENWSEAHKKNFPFMLYNTDEKAPGAPQRMGGADVPIALIQESNLASEEIKAVTGIFDASLGNKGNEQSGRAIYARQQQGEIATFNYQDNMSKGIQLTYEIILDLIPEIYDTERELRILGSDGAEDFKKVNQVVIDHASGKAITVNDMSKGKYDVTITSGPSFSTLRQEAAETYGNLAQQFPELMGVAGDLIMKSMDLPYADDIAERMKTLLPPQIQQQMDNKEVPPEVQQAMQQADQAMQQVQQYGQMVQEAAAELEGEKANADKAKSEVKVELANLKAAKAEFEAYVAKELARVVQAEAGLTQKSVDIKEQTLSLEASKVDGDALQRVDGIDEVLAQFMEAADGALGSISEKLQQIEQQANRQPVDGVIRRENGKTFADIEYSDGTKKTIEAVREKGKTKIKPDAGA